MRLLIRHIRIPILLLSILTAASGCLKEDYSNCPRDLYVCFIPENPKHDLSELVRTADLYFYDEKGDLAFGLSYEREEIEAGRKVKVTEQITPGNYILIALLNDVDHYRTVDPQRLESLQTYLVDAVSDKRLVEFFSGMRKMTVNRDESLQEICVDIFKHNNDIHLELRFDGYEIPQGSALYSYIDGKNGAYSYWDGVCPEDSYRKYQPHRHAADPGAGKILSDFTVMRLWRSSDLTLHLQEVNFAGEVTGSVKLNIAEELAEVVNDDGEFLYDTDKKLSFHDEYEIVIVLRSDLSVVELIVNGWWVIGGGIEV